MMAEVLGLDAGGTKTLALRVGPDGRVLELRSGPGLDPVAGDGPERLRACLAPFGQPRAATLGLPYHGEVAAVSRWQAEVAVEVLGTGARVMNDVAAAHTGAFAGAEGVLILAGTGSMAWARGPKGEHRVGGFGDLFGDEGSAFWIGRRALAAASRQIDGRARATGFADTLCAKIGAAPDTLIDWTYAAADRRAHVASVARAVSALAGQGDATADEVLDAAAAELALAARAAAAAAGWAAPLVWACAGGVFADTRVLAGVTGRLGLAPCPRKLPPVGGAALDAARRAGWAVDEAWIAALAADLAARGVT